MNEIMTNFILQSPSDFLEFVEAYAELLKSGQHTFTFPRNGHNAIVWNRPWKHSLENDNASVRRTEIGYGCTEHEIEYFIEDVINTAEEMKLD